MNKFLSSCQTTLAIISDCEGKIKPVLVKNQQKKKKKS